MTQPTVSKHWRRVVSHPDRPQSNHAHLTVLQYYNMHALPRQNKNKLSECPLYLLEKLHYIHSIYARLSILC